MPRHQQPATAARSRPASSAPVELKLKLHRIDVRPLRIVQRMEQQPSCSGDSGRMSSSCG